MQIEYTYFSIVWLPLLFVIVLYLNNIHKIFTADETKENAMVKKEE